MREKPSVRRPGAGRNPFRDVRPDRPIPPVAVLVSLTLVAAIAVATLIGFSLLMRGGLAAWIESAFATGLIWPATTAFAALASALAIFWFGRGEQ